MRRATRLCALLLATGGPAFAADHRDAPGSTAEPAADINDVYTFVSPEDPNKVIIVMTVFPLAGADAAFSDAIDYRINIQQLTAEAVHKDIVCTFESDDSYTCTGPSGAATAGNVGGEAATGDGIKTWAGLRDDPFFFDLAAFRRTVGLSEEGDPFCLVQGDETGTDFFLGLNTLAIVIEITSETVRASADAPQLRIWGSTTRQGG